MLASRSSSHFAQVTRNEAPCGLLLALARAYVVKQPLASYLDVKPAEAVGEGPQHRSLPSFPVVTPGNPGSSGTATSCWHHMASPTGVSTPIEGLCLVSATFSGECL